MGNFSRNPEQRLAAARARRYFALRMQQGVPLLDADWNESAELRHAELADLALWVLGDGVPSGTDGFRILPLAGGGMNTVVLTATPIAGASSSSLAVDTTSTAASALGFDETNFQIMRVGSDGARLTGRRTGPFNLPAGSTLRVSVNGQPSVTITFGAGDFADSAAATAAEVAAVITGASAGVLSAAAGAGNDFLIKGGDGTFAGAARLVAGGVMVVNERSVRYTEQPLYDNTMLAAAWSVLPVAPLVAPSSDEVHLVYLDHWAREVGPAEDPDLIDERIGLETAVRLRREWAVRVVPATQYEVVLEARPPGHTFYVLGSIERTGGDAAIHASMLADERDTGASLRREVAVFGTEGTLLVDTARVAALFMETRDTFRDFSHYLVTEFLPPSSAYLAGEVLGFEALSAVAGVAEHGLALVNARVLDRRSALGVLEQLLAAEQRLVTVWTDVVMPLTKSGSQIYQSAFAGTISLTGALLEGPAPSGLLPLMTALQRRDLHRAVLTQERINQEFGEEIGRPSGVIVVTYLGSTTPIIASNGQFNLNFRVTGSVTPDDDLGVDVTVDPAWQTTLRNGDGSLPAELHHGPGEDVTEFILTVRAPNVSAAETVISLEVFAAHNRGGLYYLTSPKTLRIGDPPPPSEEDFVITIQTTLNRSGGVFEIPVSAARVIRFRVHNNTTAAATVDLEPEPLTAPAGWTLHTPSPLAGYVINADGGHQDFDFQFVPPGTVGQEFAFTFRVLEGGTTTAVAETTITLRTVPAPVP